MRVKDKGGRGREVERGEGCGALLVHAGSINVPCMQMQMT